MGISRPAGALAVLAALALVAAACSPDIEVPQPPQESGAPGIPGAPDPGGRDSAARALRELCTRPPARKVAAAETEGPTPPAIAEIQRQTQEVRGLEFLEPVAIEAVTPDELAERIGGSFDRSFPEEQMARRTIAWRTIGVIPAGVTIAGALKEYFTGQVLGFYAPESGKLVFIGQDDPDALGKITLAHELTHALDDQHFHLERLNSIEAGCRDERAAAALGAIEGSAQFASVAFASRFLTVDDLGSLNVDLPAAGGIPPFIQELQLWPYVAGQVFVAARSARGGPEAVNQALERFPVTSEQVIHPERYPSDVPTEIGAPDLARALGEGWRDLDVMEIGEAWLEILLDLRLAPDVAAAGAAGWDGGIYRAWTNGERVAVMMHTVWDSTEEASQFVGALDMWIGEQRTASVAQSDERAIGLFASDPATLERLESAIR